MFILSVEDMSGICERKECCFPTSTQINLRATTRKTSENGFRCGTGFGVIVSWLGLGLVGPVARLASCFQDCLASPSRNSRPNEVETIKFQTLALAFSSFFGSQESLSF